MSDRDRLYAAFRSAEMDPAKIGNLYVAFTLGGRRYVVRPAHRDVKEAS